MRAPRHIVGVLLAFALLATAAGSGAAQESAPETAAPDPRLFDLGLARAELSALRAEAARLEREIVAALDEIDGLTIERDFIAMNDTARADVLAKANGRARRMAVNAYIGIGAPLAGISLLDATSANDLVYRHSLLRQQAERLNTAAETYAVLLGEADQNIVSLSNYIDDVSRRIEDANRDLRRTNAKIPEAEWFVSIAEIHALANEHFAERGRTEPTDEQWQKLRFCESTENYDIDSGNTFYGAYQFTRQTWETVGGSGNPAHAPAEEQDARARLLYAQRGAQPWPICGRFLPRS